MPRRRPQTLRRRAIRVDQNPKHPVYLFTLTGAELLQIADISRISRSDAGKLVGYQRSEVKRHIRNIVEYLDGGDVLFPNSIILAMSSKVAFKMSRGPKVGDPFTSPGILEIPLARNGAPKPAWIVDGQQRTMALSQSRRKDLPVPVNAFIADDVEVQREQFFRVNSTKPLPKGLITELLPEISTVLPAGLSARRAPSALCDLLNRDPESPLRGLIRRASASPAKRKTAVITDTAVIQMLEDSFTSPSGCLFAYQNLATGQTDVEGARAVLLTYWTAVKETFPQAWGLPAARSRLMHSAGIRGMGRLMDHVMASVDPCSRRAAATVRQDLERLRPVCHWTSGSWDQMGGLRWNDVQNLPAHIRMLSNVLVRAYLSLRRPAA